MKILFVNPPEPQCGVHQYGLNLFHLVRNSEKYDFHILHPKGIEDLFAYFSVSEPDCAIYNWHPTIGEIPFVAARKNIAIYHTSPLDETNFDAVLFSDPTAKREGKLFPIGRPLPFWQPISEIRSEVPWIGVNGFCGAMAPLAVERIVKDFDNAMIRLHLPNARWGDADGKGAEAAIGECLRIVKSKPGINVVVNREFLSTAELLGWLSINNLNCYIRDLPPDWGNGVSSVLDVAMAVRRPIAINRCAAFRHLSECTPSICVEDNDLKTIMENGTEPLVPFYVKFDQDRVRREVEACLDEVLT